MSAERFPALENHFTMDEVTQTLRDAADRHTRLVTNKDGRHEREWIGGGWRWIITRPAAEDLMDGVTPGPWAVPDDGRLTLFGYPVTMVPGSKAIIYFGQGVL